MNPNKIQKMNEEVQKWSRKDPQAIKKGMAMPGTSFFSSGLLKVNKNRNGLSKSSFAPKMNENILVFLSTFRA